MVQEDFKIEFGVLVQHQANKHFRGIVVAKVLMDDGSKGYIVSVAEPFGSPPSVCRHILSETEISPVQD